MNKQQKSKMLGEAIKASVALQVAIQNIDKGEPETHFNLWKLIHDITNDLVYEKTLVDIEQTNRI